jgi:hypothetical protein
MATSVSFYIASDHSVNIISSVVSTGSGNKHYLMDGILKTYWSPVNKNDQWVWIDTCPQDAGDYAAGKGKTSGSYDSFGLWLINYGIDFSSTRIWITSQISAVSGSSELKMWDHLSGPLYFTDLDVTLNKRYVGIYFENLPAIPKLGQIMLTDKYTLNIPNQYPVQDLSEFMNDTSIAPDGTKYTYMLGKCKISRFQRNYSLFADADVTKLKAAFDACQGSANPFIFQEGTLVTDAFVCKLDHDISKNQDESYSYSTDTFEFSSLPYIKYGNNY